MLGQFENIFKMYAYTYIRHTVLALTLVLPFGMLVPSAGSIDSRNLSALQLID